MSAGEAISVLKPLFHDALDIQELDYLVSSGTLPSKPLFT